MKKLVKQIVRELTKAGYYVTTDIHGGILTIRESMYDSMYYSITMFVTESMVYDNQYTITFPYTLENTVNGCFDSLYAYYNGRVIQK